MGSETNVIFVINVEESIIRDLLFADDCAINATIEPDMQHTVNQLSRVRRCSAETLQRLKASLKFLGFDTDTWEELAKGRTAWTTAISTGARNAESTRLEECKRRRTLCKMRSTRTSTTDTEHRDEFLSYLSSYMPVKSLPNHEDGRPAVVTSELTIESFDSINENDMDISLTFLLRFSYNIEFLGKFDVKDVDRVVLDNELVDRFWTPELYFLNEKRVYVHKTFLPNKKYTLYIGGNVTYSSRFSLTASCPMDFYAYPFDKQTCMIAIESFLHDEQTIVLKWKENNPVVLKGNSFRSLPNFDLFKIETNTITAKDKDGNFSRASMELHFVRNMGYYLTQMYIPCVISVIISWISFWIDVNAASERLGLGIVTVLTMVTHNADVNSQLPKVSYTKAIDVYMSTCLVLVFLALLQEMLKKKDMICKLTGDATVSP
ncbi:glycine receptor subunit alpha-4-like [Mercenaria mercenaria]|uniref:glycine receptor subunit alpha-4-like n=1 Tax=Mercenaria mercenaria TaxID=6596 RepID=UPI00234E5DBA|nr:glycine receptor subunit alpha-4-like [Mercenaria mercenaria]